MILRAALAAVLFCSRGWSQASAPLLLPGGLAYDTQENLYFSDTAGQVVRKLTARGVLSVVAGTGAQGSSGDGGPATVARLDAPGAVAVDDAGNLVFADTHNHRIRKVDAVTGIISPLVGSGVPGLSADGLAASATLIDLPSALAYSAAGDLYYADARTNVVRRVDHTSGLVRTVAGNGVQGGQGDGGLALAASLDSPAGLALDTAGNLYISDSHNHRVRRVDAVSGIITTAAGTGVAGFSTGAAGVSALRLPQGLTMDAAGNLYIVDAGNNRLRRVDALTGQITSVAGSGVEGFAGDGSAATQAAIDQPRSIVLSGSGLPTLADSENARIRQVDGAGIIHTIAGVGALTVVPSGLVLSGPAAPVYGSGSVSATIGGAAATGSITFNEGSAVLGTVLLAGNVASLSTAGLGAGPHTLSATFAGDAAHGLLQSNALTLSVVPAPLVATPADATAVYGVTLPALSGTLSGVLPQDAAAVQVSFVSPATQLSPAGTYAISAVLTGTAAANYALATTPATLIITKAPSSLSLSAALLAHVATTTAGQPGGSVTLLDGNTNAGTATLNAGGDAQLSATGLTTGSHTLSASYAGDVDFLPSSSTPVVVTIGPVAGADFSLASTGASAVTVMAGSSASFSFSETPLNGGLASPILLSASGLPAGATAVFSPGYLPPGGGAASFTLTVQTLKAGVAWPGTLIFAGLVGLLLYPRRRRALLTGVAFCALAGCGDRVTSAGQSAGQARTYNILVNATATSNTGATLLHSVTVTLTTQ